MTDKPLKKGATYADLARVPEHYGRIRVIASIEDPALIEPILAHVEQRVEDDLPRLSLGPRAPPPPLLL